MARKAPPQPLPSRLLCPGRWFRVRALLPRVAEDQALGLAALCGSLGAESRPAGPGRVDCAFWFGAEEAARACAARLAPLLSPRTACTVDPMTDDGWLLACTTPRPALVAGRFVVHDGLSPLPGGGPSGPKHILIPPGRAFGTGEHATTAMCLELLSAARPRGRLVADVGTGSGILAIAAALAGAARVEAVDNDPSVLEVARENLELNCVTGQVDLHAGSWQDLRSSGDFALVLANIHRTALVRGARTLAGRLAAGGRAVLSGFLEKDAARVELAWARQGCRPAARRQRGEWIAMLCIKSRA